MVDLDHLLDLTFSTPGMHISASAPLTTPAALASAEVSIRYRNTTFTTTSTSPSENNPSSSSPPAKSGDEKKKKSTIWTDAYQPGTFVPLLSAASDFDFHSSSSSSSSSSLSTTTGATGDAGDANAKNLKGAGSGGEGGDGDGGHQNVQRFRAWLKSRCVLSTTDAITSHHHGQAAIVSLPSLTLVFFMSNVPPLFIIFIIVYFSFFFIYIYIYIPSSLRGKKRKKKRGKKDLENGLEGKECMPFSRGRER